MQSFRQAPIMDFNEYFLNDIELLDTNVTMTVMHRSICGLKNSFLGCGLRITIYSVLFKT